MADGTEHLLAAQHELDRAVDQFGRHDAEYLRAGNHAFRAEAAAEERAADEDVLGRDAEQAGDAGLRHRHALARRIDLEMVAVPGLATIACGSMALWYCGAVVVGGVDADRGAAEPGLDVAVMHCRPARRRRRLAG